MRKFFVLAAMGIIALSIMACGSVGRSVSTSGPVAVVRDAAVVAVEGKSKIAAGKIEVRPPTGFLPFKSLGDPFSAIIGNKDTAIDAKDVRVLFPDNVRFKETIPDRTDVTSWITNLPAGLVGNMHEATGTAKEFKILVTGTPSETRKEVIKVTIPGEFLIGGSDVTIESNPDAYIDIAEGLISIADVAAEAEKAPWSRSSNTIIISGSVGTALVPKAITIKLDAASIAVPIPAETILSDWIPNLPDGLQALAGKTEKGATEVVLTISGVPAAAIDAPVRVRVPRDYLHRSLDLIVKADEDLRFEIFGLSVSHVIVGGAISNEILPRIFTIYFGAGKLLNDIEKDTDVSRWFGNIPAGLRILTADPASAGASLINVRASGTPTAYIDAPMKITIPANIIYTGRSFDVQSNENARFEVGSLERETNRLTSNGPDNKKFLGDNSLMLNTPKLVEVKDFEAVGLVSVTAQSVNDIGPDGSYSWTGDEITYSKLLAEARKLNAHAVINIIVDYHDETTQTVEKRRIPAGYKLSVAEVALNAKVKGRFSIELQSDGTYMLVEKRDRTVRTYTGNALAIRYGGAVVPKDQEVKK
jgi:hypothetical protein